MATCQACQADSQSSSKWHRLQPALSSAYVCVPSILDVTTNIVHIGCRGCFVFVSVWLYSPIFFFFSPACEKACFGCQSERSLNKVFLKTPFLCVPTLMLCVLENNNAVELLEGYHFLLSTINLAGVICNPLTHCSWLYWAIASTWGELNAFSSHLPGMNKLPENVMYDPNFPDAYDRCLSLQVRVNCEGVYFSILTNL